MKAPLIRSEGALWIAFGVLWSAATWAGMENVRRGEDPALRYSGRGSYEHYWFFLLAYLVGGAVVAMLHSHLADNLPGSTRSRSQTPAGVRFETEPAKKFFAMWPTGAIGIIFVLALPSALFGSGVAWLFCLGFGGLLILMAFVPKLWRSGSRSAFTVAPGVVQSGNRSLVVDSASAFAIGNSLRFKPYKVPEQIGSRMSGDLRNNVYYAPGGNPLAAEGLAGIHDTGLGIANAIGNGLAEMAHRYYVEMRARSWQLKVTSDGKELVLADGLDGGSAQALLDEVVVASAVRRTDA